LKLEDPDKLDDEVDEGDKDAGGLRSSELRAVAIWDINDLDGCSPEAEEGDDEEEADEKWCKSEARDPIDWAVLAAVWAAEITCTA